MDRENGNCRNKTCYSENEILELIYLLTQRRLEKEAREALVNEKTRF